MVEDIKKKKEEEEEKKKEEEKKTSWITKVPTLWKIAGIIFLFLQFQRISATGGGLKQMWVWVVVVLGIWYAMGTEGKRKETVILTPEDADKCLRKEIKRKQREGQISKFATIYYGPNNGLFIYEGMPRHYQIEVTIIHNFRTIFKRAIVGAEGLIKGYVTLQDSEGKLTGREPIPVNTPGFFKKMRKYGIEWDKLFTENE